jgi:large subunit ribosomal protein L28
LKRLKNPVAIHSQFCYNTQVAVLKEVLEMARCAICEKGAHFGNNVSHSHRRSNKMWKSNIKHVTVKVNGANKKMYVCTSCLRSGKVERA